MKKLIFLATIILPLVFISCDAYDSPPSKGYPPLKKEKGSAIIWKNPLKHVGFSSNAYIVDSLLLLGNGEPFSFAALNINTGDTIWLKEDFPNIEPVFPEETAIQDNNLVLSNGEWLIVLDLKTGEEKWKYALTDGRSDIAIINNWIYKSDYTKSENKLFRFDIETGRREFVFRKGLNGDYSPGLLMPVKWINPQGDEILILQNRTFNWRGVGTQDPDSASRMDVLAYNMTADSMLWYRTGLNSSSSMARPAISGDKVYFFAGYKTHCIDAATGKSHWDYDRNPADLYGGFVSANILIIGDKLIVKPDSEWMYAIDKETGKNIWTNKNTPASPSLLTYHNDTIWLAGGGVFGVDANTGETVADWNNGGNGSWISPIAINPANGYIYTTDVWNVYCLDPKKLGVK